MPYTQTDDLAVKTGEYQKDGETKGRFENIGRVLNDGENELYLV